jgi:hypothetical protein
MELPDCAEGRILDPLAAALRGQSVTFDPI